MGETFAIMAKSRKKQLSVPRSTEFRREEVVQAFHDSFELIGGVPRLATWAHENPSDFYRLYAKLFPGNAQKSVTHDGKITVIHQLAPGPLDELPTHMGGVVSEQ